MVGAVHNRGLELGGAVGLVSLQHLGGHTGGKRGRHGGTRIRDAVRPGAYPRRRDIVARCRHVGFRVPVSAVVAAGAGGGQLIFLIAGHTQGFFQIRAQTYLQLTGGGGFTHFSGGAFCHTEPGDALITADRQGRFLFL